MPCKVRPFKTYLLPLILFFSLLSDNISASKIESGFEALSIYDYFKAKKIFYKELKKNKAYASFGLATIYYKNDNPFSNNDSACKYAHLSFNSFKMDHENKTMHGFVIDSSSIITLCNQIAKKLFQQALNERTEEALNHFLRQNYLADPLLLDQAVDIRDAIVYDRIMKVNKSDSTLQFIKLHPQSKFIKEAELFTDKQIFKEKTTDHSEEEYISFIQKYPLSTMLNSAYENLFNIYKEKADINGLNKFVSHYKNSPQINEAWKLLFSLSVKSYSAPELEKFLQEHSDFPFKNSILKELELNKLVLYRYEMDDYFGWIDNNTKIIIPAVYDLTEDFNEGLAVVNKNDSVYFINKENINPFDQYFTEAYSFKNGIAAVKQNAKWGFINRQGQATGNYYDEINESSNNIYTVKLNGKYGAIDQYGQKIIDPRFDKLGDFVNEFAYYIENGKYGFISKDGKIHPAEFEWISDFSENKIAIYKQNNLYGLVNRKGEKILDANYDQILKSKNEIYLIVKNNLYGFYHSRGCFITQIAYDFYKEKPVDFYTDGNIFKIIKKTEMALMDGNGKQLIDFGNYEEIGFPKYDLVKVKRKNKYGYLDSKLNIKIPIKYDNAEDFNDSVAIVKQKGLNSIIDIAGKELFNSEEVIEKISEHYFTINNNEEKTIISKNGQKIYSNIKNIQFINKKLIIITLNNNEIKLLSD